MKRIEEVPVQELIGLSKAEFDEAETFIYNQLAEEEWKKKADEEYQKALQEDWNQYQHDRELGLA